MGDLSPNFSRHEFACKCGCGQDTVDSRLVTILQGLRDHFRAPIWINSGNRCQTHNFAVGGAPKSQHLLSRAADISIRGVPPAHVRNIVVRDYPDASVGLYNTFTHIDTRTGSRAQWDMRT